MSTGTLETVVGRDAAWLEYEVRQQLRELDRQVARLQQQIDRLDKARWDHTQSHIDNTLIWLILIPLATWVLAFIVVAATPPRPGG